MPTTPSFDLARLTGNLPQRRTAHHVDRANLVEETGCKGIECTLDARWVDVEAIERAQKQDWDSGGSGSVGRCVRNE